MTERVRHIKRGTTYKVLFRAMFCSSADPSMDGADVVVYECEQDGGLFVRPEIEFDDPKRFEKLPEVE